MRAIACTTVAVLVALALAGCSDESFVSTATPTVIGVAAPTPASTSPDLDALRQRAAVSLAANRLHTPAGDNAVENYLAPYVVIGAEQATADRMFDEAQRLIGLLERMDAGAPASPRLREALAVARASAVASAPAARALISRVPARFPESALRRRLEGEVEVGVVIRADGSVQSVDVVRATPPGVFDREAVLAVRRWRYAPAEVESQARVVLQFRHTEAN